MGKGIDIALGSQFDRWTVLVPAASRYGQRMWLCRCTCGTEREVCAEGLLHGKSRSCGCIRIEQFVERPHNKHIHGESKKTTEWVIWNDMMRRCRNPNDAAYPRYGGRGIKVCERWHDYRNFLADMGRRPSDQLMIERRDNDGDYEPGNVYWATIYEQANNKSNNIRIPAQGQILTATQWARKIGIAASTIRYRVRKGWPVERILDPHVMSSKESSALARDVRYGRRKNA